MVQEEYTINFSYREFLLDSLGHLGVVKEFEKDSLIEFEFKKLDCIYLILDGIIRQSFIDTDGKEKTILILSKGDIFGEITMIQEDYDQVVTKTYSYTKVCRIDKDIFNEFLMKNPEVYNSILIMITTKFRILMSQVYDTIYLNTEDRVFNLLNRLSVQHGESTDKGVKINLRLTHEEIANMVGSTRSTVTKLIKKLEKDEKIMRVGKDFFVLKK